jgi:hypothetical protein
MSFFSPDNRIVPCADEISYSNHHFYSKESLKVDQKYHIAIRISENKISLFVDGELDNELIRTGKMNWNDGPLYIGESPGVAGLEITIENMNFYDYPLSVNQIRLDMGNKSDSPFSMVSRLGKDFWICF